MPPEAPDALATQARPSVPPVKSLQSKGNVTFNFYRFTESTVPVGKHIGQTKVRVILQRVQIEEVRYVHVLVAECIVWSIVGVVARRIIVDLNTLHLQEGRQGMGIIRK